MRRAFFILVLAGAVSMAIAGLVDTFDAGNTSVWTSTVTPQSYSSSNAVPVPGGTRYLGQNYAGDPGRIASAIVSPWLGSFNVSTPYGAETTTALAYGNITSTVNFGSSPNWNVDNAGSNLNLGGDTLRLNFNGNERNLVQ